MSSSRHEVVHRLFTEAVRRPPAERDVFLDEACPDDAAVRAEVAAMLAEDARAGGAFDAAVDAGGAQFLAAALARDGDLETSRTPLPERIGKYRVLRRIAEGGMGVVYEAEQEDPRRRVALKVVRSSMVTPGLLQRFRHEARVLGHLRHPGIAQIYEAGSADVGAGGQPYFAMELIEGDTITDFAEARGLGTRARLELLAQLCDILEYAHRKGVIHRDLKPANILVTTDITGPTSAMPGQPLLKVLDFGVARATDEDLSTVTLQTTVGQLVGTVPYMSPEQASGDPSEIDTRSDVYAVGVVGWELLTGRLPYDVRGKLVHEAVRVIRESEASRLSSIDRDLRGDVETIFAKALEKNKERRYQSAAEMAADLRRHLADEPIAARPASALYQLRKFARRNRTLVGGAVATFVVAVVGATVATRYAVVATERAAELARSGYITGIAAAANAIEHHEMEAAAAYLDAVPEAHRGWEHAYLRARLAGHAGEWETPMPLAAGRNAGAPVFDAEGVHMYAALRDCSIGVWETATGRLLRAMPLHPPEMEWWRVALHGPTARVAARDADGRLAILDLETGATLHSIPTAAPPRPLAWSPDGARLLYEAGDAIFVWDGARSLAFGRMRDIRQGAFDPSGARLACASGTVVTVDVASGAIERESRDLQDECAGLAWAPDGGRLVYTGLYGNDYVLDASTLDVVAALEGHREVIGGVAWGAGGRLVTVSSDGTLRVWSPGALEPLRTWSTGFDPGETTVALLPDGATVVAAGSHVRLFPLEDPTVLRGQDTFVYHVAFSPDGRRLASSGFADPDICVWDVATGRLVRKLVGPSPGSNQAPVIAFSDDGRRLVAGTSRGVRNWDATSWATLPVPPQREWSAWLVETHGGTIDSQQGLARSPDGLLVAQANQELRGGVLVFEHASCGVPDRWAAGGPLPGAAPITVLEGHAGPTYAVAFGPDGTRLATGGRDATIRIWDTRTFEQLLVLRGHTDYVMKVAFSPDGMVLASASGDTTVRLWDTLPLHERRAQDRR